MASSNGHIDVNEVFSNINMSPAYKQVEFFFLLQLLQWISGDEREKAKMAKAIIFNEEI